MAVRPAGVLRLGRRAFGPSQLLVVAAVTCLDPAAAMDRVHAAVAEGADVVEVSGVVPLVAAVRGAYPELVVGVSAGRPEVAREACAAGADVLCRGGPGPVGSWGFGLAAEFGAGVVCPVAMAARAVEAGVEPERVIVEPDGIAGLAGPVATGWPVLVSPSDVVVAGGLDGGLAEGLGGGLAGDLAGDLAGGLAVTAVAAWQGARVFRVGRVRETRRVLSMVSAIRGDIPPACAVRGLALLVDSRSACRCNIVLARAGTMRQRHDNQPAQHAEIRRYGQMPPRVRRPGRSGPSNRTARRLTFNF